MKDDYCCILSADQRAFVICLSGLRVINSHKLECIFLLKMGLLIPHVLSSVDKTNPTAKYLKVSELYFGSAYDEQCSYEHS